MADAWGGAWADAWGASWGFSGAVAPETDTHDGGYSREEYDRLRKRIREAEKATELSRKKRRETEQRLVDELDRAYRKVVLNEPDIALAVAEAVVPEALAASEPDELPIIDWSGLTDLLSRAAEVLAILDRDRAEAEWLAQDEADIEILLLC